ncbi:MAG: serine/threonine-protein kinase [Kofleriaceae bacterium]
MWPEGTHDPALAPGTMVGEYRIEALVGEGGMGQVYGAVHPVIGKRAAIKVLLPEIGRNRQMVERFVMEARAVNQIGHPNIVDVFAFGVLPDGRQYMVMEWLRGLSLSDRLKRGVPLIPETCDVLHGVAAALDAAHASGIVHRDLKPHNVFLVDVRDSKPLVKLLDFGLVKLGDSDDNRLERTRQGAIMGTPAYMSPEQCLGKTVDTRSDNYSFGVLAFEMLTGRVPFVEETAMQLIVAHMQAPPSPPSSIAPGIPPELDRLVYALLAKDPAQRPSLKQVMGTLQYFRDPGHASGAGTGPYTPPPTMTPPGISPVAHSSPSNIGMVSTMGQSHGQLLTTRQPQRGRSRGLYAFVALTIAAAVTVVMVVAMGGKKSAAGGEAGETPPIATSIDAAVVTPPPAVSDAAILATPPSDAAIVATPPPPADAAVGAVMSDAAAIATQSEPPKPKPPKPKPPKPKPPDPTTKPPPPEDDDGLIRVTPKKN